MHEPFPVCTLCIMGVTVVFSWMGFRDPVFRERHLFSVREVLAGKQYHRLLTSALLHADWNHLLLNLFTIYLFGSGVELELGIGQFLLVYVASVIGGDLLSLWIHRHHHYQALGASGGACGLVFSYIFLFPGSHLGLLILPVMFPAWLYAVFYLVASFFALKKQVDNVGHDAHLGGAIIGLMTTVAIRPEIVRWQPKLFATICALSVLLFVYLLRNPLFLPISSFLPSARSARGKPADPAVSRGGEAELNAVLEKISRDGIESLTSQEKALLNSSSEEYRRRSRPG